MILHHMTLHGITLHYITLHYITLHYITLHYITLQGVSFEELEWALDIVRTRAIGGAFGFPNLRLIIGAQVGTRRSRLGARPQRAHGRI